MSKAQIATGFLAVGPWGNGDADKEKMLTDIVDDQLNATSRAFLALTVTCARCHDHKFDPIPTADYYSLAGIFYPPTSCPTSGPRPTVRRCCASPCSRPINWPPARPSTNAWPSLKSQLAALFNARLSIAGQEPAAANRALSGRRLGISKSRLGRRRPSADRAFATAQGLDPRLLAQWLTTWARSSPNRSRNSRPDADGIAGLHAWVHGNLSEPISRSTPTMPRLPT